LRRVRPLLIPGVVLVGAMVNVPLISQASTAVTVGSVLVPVLAAARVSPTTAGAALAPGSGIRGAPPQPRPPPPPPISARLDVPSIACVEHVWPLLLVHLAVTVPVFWLLSLRAEALWRKELGPTAEADPGDVRVNWFKALVPLVPLALLFLTAPPPRYR